VRAHPAIAGSSGAAGGHEHRRLSLPRPARQTETLSMRVTGNYRITFGWSGENALDVDFEDYH
jgi:plasmid maintenance system killer protein